MKITVKLLFTTTCTARADTASIASHLQSGDSGSAAIAVIDDWIITRNIERLCHGPKVVIPNYWERICARSDKLKIVDDL